MPPPRTSPPPSQSAPLSRRGLSPTRSPASLVVLFPPSLGKSKSAARAELLQLALAHELNIPVTIRVTSSYKELETRTRAGEAHIVWAPSGVCAKLANVTRSIYKAVRQGVSTYRSAIVANRKPGVSLDHLEGLRAAWVDPYSVGGYLLAADYLRRHGAEPDRVFVQQTFHRSHSDALHAVTGGAADISAVTAWSDDPRALRDALTLHIGPIERKIVVLAVTEESPTDAVLFTTQLSEEYAERTTQKLFPSEKTGKAPSFLLAALDAEGFIRTEPAEYLPLLRLMR